MNFFLLGAEMGHKLQIACDDDFYADRWHCQINAEAAVSNNDGIFRRERKLSESPRPPAQVASLFQSPCICKKRRSEDGWATLQNVGRLFGDVKAIGERAKTVISIGCFGLK